MVGYLQSRKAVIVLLIDWLADRMTDWKPDRITDWLNTAPSVWLTSSNQLADWAEKATD